ncbi:hypothetical protein [Oceaniferula spumae]|uniref:hypothetical protein n=1 Tax=Oceaniferula spumae TaxID=2979115 RepID=UPI003F4EF8E4
MTAIGCAAFVAADKKADVIVVDPKGNPIAEAKVTPISHSMNYPAILTDKNGEVRIKKRIQKVVWIEVRKDGYLDSGMLEYVAKKPIKVELQPKK